MGKSFFENISSTGQQWLNSLSLDQCLALRNWLNGRIRFLKEIPFVKKKVEEIQLSARAYNALKANKLNTVEDILKYGTENIWRLPNVGEKTVNEIIASIS